MSEQTRYKSRILMALMLVLALWASTVLAGANEDFLKAAERGDLNAVKSFIAKGADVNAKDKDRLDRIDKYLALKATKSLWSFCSPRGPMSM